MYHLWRGLETGAGAVSLMIVFLNFYSALAHWSRNFMPVLRMVSTPKKKLAVTTTMIPTITEVIQVSFQVVQVTFFRSASVSRRNCNGLKGFLGATASVPEPPAGGRPPGPRTAARG